MPEPFETATVRDLVDWTADIVAEVDEHERRLKAGEETFVQTQATVLASLSNTRKHLVRASQAAAKLIEKEEASSAYGTD